MKRWGANGLIVAYIAVLVMGIGSHALNVGMGAHPGMYYIIWDMFCGWSAHSSRLHLVAEGESGDYYALNPPPWGELKPYGKLGRPQYDIPARHMARFAMNVLNHSSHEEMTRIFLVEESWPKKFNLPDSVWNQIYEEPKQMTKYYHVRQIISPDGVVLQSQPTWLHRQFTMLIAKNPRLQQDMHKGRPFYAVAPAEGGGTRYSVSPFTDPASLQREGSTLGE